MSAPKRNNQAAAASIDGLVRVMAKLRSPEGCPWDREQDHKTLRWHAVEEVYELLDAIDEGSDSEMAEELGDLLMQVVFHWESGTFLALIAALPRSCVGERVCTRSKSGKQERTEI